MKPFITPDMTPTGKKAFPYQCEGAECKELWSRLKGQSLVAYSLPEGHTLQTAWELVLVFDSGLTLEFSSACSQAVDWQEVGSLNVRVAHLSIGDGATTASKKNEIPVSPIDLVAAEKLIYEDDDVVVECGLVLCGRDSQEVVIAAGVPPGSVTAQAPFSMGQSFEPQFRLSECKRQRM
jgi:hypothetical protein